MSILDFFKVLSYVSYKKIFFKIPSFMYIFTIDGCEGRIIHNKFESIRSTTPVLHRR